MSDKPPAPEQTEEHVDTPAQAAARQMIDTIARVTHVHVDPPPAEPPAADEKEDLSLAALLPKKPIAPLKSDVTLTRTTTTHVSRSKDTD